MNKKLLFLFLFLLIGSSHQTKAQSSSGSLSVTGSVYTHEQLVRNVLVSNPCLEVSNVTSLTGTNFGSSNGIGFFQNSNPNFPLSSGIVLSTGDIASIPGQNSATISDGTHEWPGDTDLEAIVSNMASASSMNSKNATVLEFDFTALNEYMSFNFLFASEEYGTFQCTFADAFAFLLTDLETGITTNLAVVPGTQDPISVVTIRDSQYNDTCESVNEGYFDKFFAGSNPLAGTNFNGQTQIMTASSALIPNHPYHIKLVVADRNDTLYDSAVFIEAGSFAMGPPQCFDRLQLVAFLDSDSNGVKDENEASFGYGSFAIEQNNSGSVSYVQSPIGTHEIYYSETGNLYNLSFEIQPEYASYYAPVSAYQNLEIEAGIGVQTVFFPIQLTQDYQDVAVWIIPMDEPRPGREYKQKMVYANFGTSAASGTLNFEHDALVSIVDVSESGTTPTPSGFSFAFSNLAPNESRSITVEMHVPDPPIVNMDDILVSSASVSASDNDINLSNNLFLINPKVVNSYDPNMIVEAHGELININNFSLNEYLYYTIYFQNIGTAMAINVLVEDMLDNQLNGETLVTLNSSHTYSMMRTGNFLAWKFYDIMLPGQLQNEELSKGFVFFKVKVKAGIEAGDVIPNMASIYFDSNPVINTNTFNTTFYTNLSQDEWSAGSLLLYPNPAHSSFSVSLMNSSDSLSSVVVYDMIGKVVSQADVLDQNQANVDVSGLGRGVYMVEIGVGENRVWRKLVVN